MQRFQRSIIIQASDDLRLAQEAFALLRYFVCEAGMEDTLNTLLA